MGGGAGAGAAAFNTSKAVTRAYVDGLTQVDTAVRAAESPTVKATNTSTLEATAVGASAAGTGSGLALSVGAAVAGNKTPSPMSTTRKLLSSGTARRWRA